MINQEKFFQHPLPSLLAHVSIVHHLPGRLRLRLQPTLWELLPALAQVNLDDYFKKIPGIMDWRINISAASLTINYDPQCLSMDWWEKLMKGDSNTFSELSIFFDNQPFPQTI